MKQPRVSEDMAASAPASIPAAGDSVAQTPDPVRMVCSARFYVEAIHAPPGISARDLPGFIEGEVEELSLFPLESTAWGYLESRRKNAGYPVLIYAALREQVNGASDPFYAQRHAVLPGFAALAGRASRKTVWITLVEPSCVSLVRIPARGGVPDRVHSRYGTGFDEQPELAWAIRRQLLDTMDPEEDEPVEEGLVRGGKPGVDRRGNVVFPLERQRTPQAPWKRWATAKLGPEAVLLAADVRDGPFLAEERNRRHSLRQLRAFVRMAVVAFLLMAFFQYQYMKRSREVAALNDQVGTRRSIVESLKKQETLAKSAARLSDPALEIFDWLTAVNEVRPDAVAFETSYADRGGRLGFSGEAPSALVVNQYRDALEKSGRFDSVEIKQLTSAKRGVQYTMQVIMKSASGKEAKGS